MIIDIRRVFILGLVFSLLLLPQNSRALQSVPEPSAPQQAEASVGEDLGFGVGSVLASMLYSPFKITYAALGLLTGGLGFVLSAGNTDVATNIINPAVRGNYVVTPRHLRGEEPIIFVGPSNSPEPQQPQQRQALR